MLLCVLLQIMGVWAIQTELDRNEWEARVAGADGQTVIFRDKNMYCQPEKSKLKACVSDYHTISYID